MAYSKWRDKHGHTVDVMNIGTDATKREDWGQWLVAKHPGGVTMQTLTNHRGWVRTMPELATLGVDLASLKEIKVYGGSTMTVAYALVKAAVDLNEPSPPEPMNHEYLRGQANLICDALGWGADDMYLPVMACLTHQITIDTLFDILRGQAELNDDIAQSMELANGY